MINNLIHLGENVDIVPFREKVDSDQEIIEMNIDLDDKNEFNLTEVEVSEVGDKNIFYIKVNQTINPGKTVHYYPHDFSLGGSSIGKGKSILYDKINRNFSNTEDFYEKLSINDNVKGFLDKFYSFVLKDNSSFMEKVYNKKEDFITNLTKRDLSNLIFVFKLSNNIIEKYDLNVKDERDYYYLGDVHNILDLFKKLISDETSKEVNENDSKCSFCNNEEDLYSPSMATFYYSFTFDQKSGFYGLNDENVSKHLIMCSDCFGDYNKGKKFMESYFKNSILGVNYFSLLEINEKNKDFESLLDAMKKGNLSKVYSSDDLRRLRNNLKDNTRSLWDLGLIGQESNLGVDLFFYVYDNGYRLVKLMKDIYPNRILDLLKANDEINGFSFNGYLIELFSSNKNEDYDLLIKERINLFEKILLEIPINYDSLTDRFINKVSYKLRNQETTSYEASNFTQSHMRFLELLSKLNCELFSSQTKTNFDKKGDCVKMVSFEEEIEGDTGLEKMQNFISKNEFFANTPEINTGIPLGVTIARLSYDINNYEKRMLGYARKRINDDESLRKYVNEIEEKAVMHDIANQPIVSSFFDKVGDLFTKDSFSKDDFIFGMFIGYSLANKFTNPDQKSVEGENNE